MSDASAAAVDKARELKLRIASALVIGPLVFVHEMGHYLVGRLFGVGADVFSIGFGKELVGWTDKRGTRWKISALPLGGYVQFAGDMNPASQPSAEWLSLPPEQRNRTFQSKPLWQRALIVLAADVATRVIHVGLVVRCAVASARRRGSPRVPAICFAGVANVEVFHSLGRPRRRRAAGRGGA